MLFLLLDFFVRAYALPRNDQRSPRRGCAPPRDDYPYSVIASRKAAKQSHEIAAGLRPSMTNRSRGPRNDRNGHGDIYSVIIKFSKAQHDKSKNLHKEVFMKKLKRVFLTFLVGIFLLSVAWANLVNLNTASKEELQTLPGVGPKVAERIVEYRQKYGPFKSIDELLEIKGIGPKKLEKIKPLVTLETTSNKTLKKDH